MCKSRQRRNSDLGAKGLSIWSSSRRRPATSSAFLPRWWLHCVGGKSRSFDPGLLWWALALYFGNSPCTHRNGTMGSQTEVLGNLQKHLLPHVKKDIFLLVDANGRVGSTRDSSVGGYAADDTNENGSLFQTLLRNIGLWLPSTFEECVADIDDTAGTWLSRGGWKRIDFVAHNASSSLCGVQTWNIDFEKDVLQDDHRAVCLGIHVFKRRNGQYEKSFHSSLKVNTEAMTTEEGKCRCQQILKHLTQTRPSWAAPADTHAEHLMQGAQEALEYWFPVSNSRPKPSWISDSTWSTLASTRKARHQLRFLRTSWRKGVLREIFLSWRNGSNRSSFAHWQKQHDHAVATAMRNLHRARSERIRLMKADENHYLEEQARIAHDELHEAKGTQLWKLLKKSLPKYRNRRKKPLPMAEAHQQFTKHFADIEEAKEITMEQLQSQILQRSPKALHEAIRSEMPLDQLPSVFELEDAIRTLNNQKAFVGCIPAELLRAAPAQAAELLYPALLSFFRFYQQPATWKGGQYYPLYKGKGAVDRPGSFRAILLGNVVPKVFHKIVRSRLVQQVQHRLLPFQIGGLPHMSVHFAAHFLQTLRSQANLQKKSSAVLFFDLKSAFYRAQRSTVVADSLGYGDDPEDEDVVLTTLVQQSALDNLEVTPSLQKVIQELFSQTWCTVLTTGQKPQNVLQSVRGTRPGDPVADLAFTCIMKQILERFMRTAAPLLPRIATPHGDIVVPAITWVDDVAIYLETESASDLVPLATEAVKMMHQQCRAVGLDLNYEHGKTEVLFRFHGRNSDNIRKQLHQEGKISLGDGLWESVKLPIATKYTHLGIKHSANMAFDVELNYRLARAREALADSRKLVLQNKALTPQVRWGLSKALIQSRLFFGAEIWPVLTTAQSQKVQQFLFKVARIILNCENFAEGLHTTDDAVRAQLMVPDITSVLRSARLRYASRLYLRAPSVLVDLLHQATHLEDSSWVARLQDDMAWMQERVANLHHLNPPHLDFNAWQLKMQDVKDWTAMVRRALEADTIYRHNVARYQVWRMQFRAGMEDIGCEFPEVSDDAVNEGDPQWKCEDCQRVFFTAKALSVHRYKQHQAHAAARCFMDSSSCGCCLKDFHTVQRLRQHLQYPKGKCLSHLQQVWWPMDASNLVAFRPNIDVKASHRIPAMQGYGPKLPTLQQWQAAAPTKLFPPSGDFAVDESSRNQPSESELGVEPSEDPPRVNPTLFARIDEFVQSWQSQRTTAPEWPELDDPAAFATIAAYSNHLQDVVVQDIECDAYLEAYGWIECLLSRHFVLQRAPHRWKEPQRAVLCRQPTSKASLPNKPPTWISDFWAMPSSPPWIPRQPKGCGAVAYILYVYSGHRRDGDMVFWAKALGQQRNFQVEVITIDVIYDARLCDMRDPSARKLWQRYVAGGYFFAVIGAPPCETYSAARFQEVAPGEHGPPPVRSLEEPWGKAVNAVKYQRQVLVANDLMQSWLLILLAAYRVGTMVVMEHPAASVHRQEAPSIWKTVELMMIAQLPRAAKHLVVQGLYGAVSAKPTTFLVCHLEKFASVLRKWQDPQAKASAWIHLRGKGADGSWLTAQGKAYPSRLNAAIIDSILGQIDPSCVDGTRSDLDPEFGDHVGTVLQAQEVSGQSMGPDFARNWIHSVQFCMARETDLPTAWKGKKGGNSTTN